MAIRAQVILKTTDNVPANFLTNTLAFGGTAPESDVVALEAAIDTFYSTWMNNYAGKGMSGTGHEIKWYDLPGLTPNYPWRTTSFDTGANPTAEALPSEVSLVLSFQGAKAAGFPQARRRGRIYMGSCRQSNCVDGRPTSVVITGLTGAATTFKAAVLAIATDTTWAVWSQADGDDVEITNGWVDNAWDTQRRRGVQVTSRTTYT